MDSISNILSDSSILNIKPLLQDTLQQVAAPIRYDGIPIPSLPATEAWVSWAILILSMLLVTAWAIDPHTIYTGFDVSLKSKERESIFKKTSIRNIYSLLFFYIYQTGIIALAVYIGLFQEDKPFALTSYLVILLTIGLAFLAKYLIFKYLEYVFFYRKNYAKKWIETYFNIIGATSIIILPCVVLYLFLPSQLSYIPVIITVGCCLVSSVVLIIKLFQLFFQKLLASFYILLYLCTLEILPVFGIISTLKNII